MKILKTVISFGTIISTLALSQAAKADSAEELAQEVAEMMEISPSAKKIGFEGIDKILQTPLYEVKVKIKQPSGGDFTYEAHAAKVDGELIFLEKPTTDEPMPGLMKILNPKFELKTVEDAKKVEAVLDKIYPVSSFDEEHKAIVQKEGRFIFVRGDFFEDLQGFVFMVDENGKILKVAQELRLKMD